jgi:hypothetical protein
VSVVASTLKDCWGNTVTRGNCNAARVPVHDLTVAIPGPTMTAVHVIAAAAIGELGRSPVLLKASGARIGVAIGDDVAVWSERGAKAANAIAYEIARPSAVGTHVISDIAAAAKVTSMLQGDKCQVAIDGVHSASSAAPVVFTVDAQCVATRHEQRRPMVGESIGVGAKLTNPDSGANPVSDGSAGETTSAAPSAPIGKRASKSGCCDAGDGQSAGVSALCGLLLLGWGGRRRSQFRTA